MGRHAIIVIKNENKYLQYYDDRWHSMLFLNCKITNKDDILSINNYLKETLNINNCTIDYIGEKMHTKYSVSSKIEKEYIHDFYLVSINKLDSLPSNYKYMSYDELLDNEEIMKINSDIISYVKEFNI